MAKTTVPNQNIVIIKKTAAKSDFLQINNKEWMQAAMLCDRNFNTFKLYLYLAANEIGYEKALSQVAVENMVGIKRSSYYSCLQKLEDMGYLVDIGNNKFEFYTTPVHSSGKIQSNGKVEKNIDSVRVENSIPVEKVDENQLSTQAENSIEMENEEKNQDSAEMENSTLVEKVYETFNF